MPRPISSASTRPIADRAGRSQQAQPARRIGAGQHRRDRGMLRLRRPRALRRGGAQHRGRRAFARLGGEPQSSRPRPQPCRSAWRTGPTASAIPLTKRWMRRFRPPRRPAHRCAAQGLQRGCGRVRLRRRARGDEPRRRAVGRAETVRQARRRDQQRRVRLAIEHLRGRRHDGAQVRSRRSASARCRTRRASTAADGGVDRGAIAGRQLTQVRAAVSLWLAVLDAPDRVGSGWPAPPSDRPSSRSAHTARRERAPRRPAVRPRPRRPPGRCPG